MKTAIVAQARIDTPLGPMTAAATARGIAGLWFDGQRHHPGPLAVPVDESNPHIDRLRCELAAYWAGKQAGKGAGNDAIDGTRNAADEGAGGDRLRFTVALDPQGTPFQRRVWRALAAIAPGHTDRYGAIAARLGMTQAARAVGAAVGRNPVSIVIPCHRVLGSDGTLTGYAGGLARKSALLAHEGALRSQEGASTQRAGDEGGPRSGPRSARYLKRSSGTVKISPGSDAT